MIATLVSWMSTYLTHPLTGLGYQFWSGIGSDAGEASIFVAVVAGYRHHNCSQKGCLRLGRFSHGPYKLCHVHHPEVPSDGVVTYEHISAV